jgi:putative restriction endonuclease
MYLALIEPESYLDFANPVPFKDSAGWIEHGILNEHGRVSGRAQSAVRSLSSDDFKRIVKMGLEDSTPLLPRLGEPGSPFGFEEGQTPFHF